MKGSNNIKASALGYAISFLLLTGLISTGVLFIASANKRLEQNYLLSEHMLFNNYLGLRYGASMVEAGHKQFVHTSGDTTKITVRNWGAYQAVTSVTFHGHRLVEKSALVGRVVEDPLPALYIPDRKQVVKLCGKTLIEGEVYTSKRGFERGHIAGAHFEGDKLLHGTLREAERELPALRGYVKELDYEHLSQGAIRIEPFLHDSTFRFTDDTRLWTSTDPIHLSARIEGNLIIHSFDSIFVMATAALNHVILMAPVIRFESGFDGCVQAIATQRISCEKETKLRYPSALIMHESEAGELEDHGIFMAEGSMVLGGILLLSDHQNFRRPPRLLIREAMAGGLVYNVGETELKGKLIGSLYTEQLALKLGGGEYRGYLYNATLSSRQLPEDFVMPDWLTDVERKHPKLLACF